jgi:cold shock CspA family protein
MNKLDLLPDEKPSTYFGLVTSVNEVKGYCFLEAYIGGRAKSVFLHFSQVSPGSPTPQRGMKATFEIAVDKKSDRVMAVNAQMFNESS